jgi:hypothetical protein
MERRYDVEGAAYLDVGYAGYSRSDPATQADPRPACAWDTPLIFARLRVAKGQSALWRSKGSCALPDGGSVSRTITGSLHGSGRRTVAGEKYQCHWVRTVVVTTLPDGGTFEEQSVACISPELGMALEAKSHEIYRFPGIGTGYMERFDVLVSHVPA